ncbi:hypothetical protein TrLO_g8321 [Triparma laevis f. longispina]|uniref:Calcineurin-like phosphoesterase domain-containing protein n=1 Tax=Triparma laevis f. longispina TaxID=1714387 RepID=A0A9W7F4G8_9STRA|nr:hypothetical protein TrLO_g8321 [Triparma laevis f. longispina]
MNSILLQVFGFLILSVALIIGTLQTHHTCTFPSSPYPPLPQTVYEEYTETQPPTKTSFAIIADLQRTYYWECIIGREVNLDASSTLLNSIARGSSALAFLVINGDAIFDGNSYLDWSYFDSIMTPIHSVSLPVLVTLGNHEYWPGLPFLNGLDKTKEKFQVLQNLKRTWYSKTFSGIGLIFLDGNYVMMSDRKLKEQVTW